jgi:pyruvate/2-oxoglutarate dehydrogenase complex dihydrolipoamide dehydrogenase (E3) component
MASSSVTVLPQDEYNQQLVHNTHPADWENPEPQGRYNLVVLGAGTAGLVTAAGAAALGAKVALVERHLMGGDCLNVGCVPSKGLIRSARAFAEIRDAASFGVVVPPGAAVDFPAVMSRMRRLRTQISPNDSVHRYREMGVDVFLGEARFSGPRTVEIDDGKTLHFAKAVVATGARAAAPPIPGLEEAGYLTNETLFTLTELPRRLAVIGAGPIGCEMSQSFARFGSEVFLLEKTDRILPRESPAASELVERAFARDGVNLVKECEIEGIERRGVDKVIRIKCRDGSSSIAVDEILVGVGRAPNVDGMNLEAAGVAYDLRRGIEVNDYLQTTNRRIYAAGDVCFPYKFTHTAEALASIAIQNSLFFRTKKSSALTIPWCTYTDPEVAHVGLTEGEAKSKGVEVDEYEQRFHEVDRAILDGEEDGFARVLTRRGSDEILGATIVAGHAGEMIGEITVAMTGKVGLGSLANVIHPYPTQAESIKRAGRAYMRTRLTPRVKKLMERWMAWRR